MTERRAVYAERNGVAVVDPDWLGAKSPRELIDMIEDLRTKHADAWTKIAELEKENSELKAREEHGK